MNMIRLNQIKIPISSGYNDYDNIKSYLNFKLKVNSNDLGKIYILKKSIDARKKPDLFYIYSFALELKTKDGTEQLKTICKKKHIECLDYIKTEYHIKWNVKELPERPVVIGAGPAGLFASYLLAINGLCPILLERGSSIEERTQDVRVFWETGKLKPESNVQFGEGGAGAFSDGKLNTLVKDKSGRNRFVLETFVKFGADENILYENKPHVGTDRLYHVVSNMRKEIIRLGGQICFQSKVTGLEIVDQRIVGLMINDDKILHTNDVILAIGHSARDTFQMLFDSDIQMKAKEFAVGFRVEHPQSFINESQYGKNGYSLPPAPYKLATKLENGRGVYSFCMCPGGFVVNASSEEGMLAVNGMSYFDRASNNANSAIVVAVGAKEYDLNDPLSAIAFQRSLEKKAYELGEGQIPQQLLKDFLSNQPSLEYGDFISECKGRAKLTNLRDLLNEELNSSLIDGFQIFDHKIHGFMMDHAILSGIESRTSSPVRICRDEETFNSNIEGLIPCGEGAGYAGGIMSAAMDGLKCAEKIMEKYNAVN